MTLSATPWLSWWLIWYIVILPPVHSKKVTLKVSEAGELFGSSHKLKDTTFNGENWNLIPAPMKFQTCGSEEKADYWMITKYFNLNTILAEVIHVDVEVEFKLCSNGSKSGDVPCYANYFEVYYYRGSKDDKRHLLKEGTTLDDIFEIYSPLYNITNTTVVKREPIRSNQTFFFPRNNSQGVAFAIRSRGACGSIYRMKMYYYYCEKVFMNGIKFEKTASPATGSNKGVKGHCTGNTIPPNNGTSLNGNCTYNGTWNIHDNVTCTCDKNYALDQGIGICLRKLC